jgi:2-oxoisovalerate dehydrogenase E1 component
MTKTTINHKLIKEALTIRKVEEKFLELFSQGKLNGTVHTCVGQEFSAIAFAGQLKRKDFVFSNHRCHGHYISFTNDVRGLLAELMGKKSGVCGGVGSSQHLCKNNFHSNGLQGGIVPVAAGYALANKLKKNEAIGLVYIGDGTLGEGVLYETMNIISKWEIPLLIVCENNFYAQSTPQHINLAGDILQRAEAFAIETNKGNTWEPDALMQKAEDAINYVRESGKPFFFLVETYRLNAHSKGDDDRDPDELTVYKEKDYLTTFQREDVQHYDLYYNSIDKEINEMVDAIILEEELSLEEYHVEVQDTATNHWKPLEPIAKRQVELINQFFTEKIETDDRFVFLGEDVLSPYGGAFKVAKDLSFKNPERVFSTPISEAALTGISNGLALNGFKPFAEIMFGDFITLAMDQIINHASKFHHMFNHQVKCPVVIRTPMGGKRGYGPTHSQTLDKLLIGIDNVKTVALNTLIDPRIILQAIYTEEHPVILIENKVDYGKRILAKPNESFIYEASSDKYPVVRVKPVNSIPDITIVAYGGVADLVATLLEDIFKETDLKPILVVPSLISPCNTEYIAASVRQTQKLVVIEEGSKVGGFGGELIASLAEQAITGFKCCRIAALPVPIPSVKSLEHLVLPEKERIIKEIKSLL